MVGRRRGKSAAKVIWSVAYAGKVRRKYVCHAENREECSESDWVASVRGKRSAKVISSGPYAEKVRRKYFGRLKTAEEEDQNTFAEVLREKWATKALSRRFVESFAGGAIRGWQIARGKAPPSLFPAHSHPVFEVAKHVAGTFPRCMTPVLS